MRKTVYVILVLCCFIIKAYSINRPYYHFKQLSIKGRTSNLYYIPIR